ncbi:MAG: argininosuccinate lyase [bacterium]
MLWGGRFNKKLDDKALQFTSSLSFDINLFHEDIEGSLAHAEMLSKVGLLTPAELKNISDGLNSIKDSFDNGGWIPSADLFEDIHSAIEARLFEVIGTTAGKLHTGRSRNDQVATDVHLWIKKAAAEIQKQIRAFQKAFLNVASKHVETIMPGYTHLQRAQPISFAFHLLAYVEMLERDYERFSFVMNEADVSPLGSGALAGSTLPLDNFFTTEKLGFKKPYGNALDAVSDRDYLLDFLNSVSIGMMHLSRLAEEVILWSSAEWKFIALADEYSTGSSLMPQKKNPDIAELVRGKTGRVYGNYLSLASTMKSLPLSYNRDMQEDKEPVFDSFNTYSASLSLFEKVIASMKVNTNRFVDELKNDFTLATDLADWLVLKGIPFRQAHEIVGKVVSFCETKQITFAQLTLEDLQNINPTFDESTIECFNIETALQRKQTHGSPNPKFVVEQIEVWRKNL